METKNTGGLSGASWGLLGFEPLGPGASWGLLGFEPLGPPGAFLGSLFVF